MRKPLIGITTGHTDTRDGVIVGARPAYVRSIELAGGLPLLIPSDLDEDTLRDVYARLDGVVLAGGADIDPSRYGMTSDGLAHDVDQHRDSTEILIARWTAANDKPMLGICRGCQVVNVALGGTLYRDLPTEKPDALNHDPSGPRNLIAHPVQVKAGTRLAEALGDESPDKPINVNSIHHQAVLKIAPRLTVSAQSNDGVVEGVELPHSRFFVAVQWHPEELTLTNSENEEQTSEAMRNLFEAFVEAARPH